MKRKDNKKAVSEIMGVLIILFMTVIAFSALYYSVLSDEGPAEQTFVKINGFVEGTNIVLEHQGGEVISEDAIISFSLPDEKITGEISNFLQDKNDDGRWNVGERLVKNFTYNLDMLDEYTVANVTAVDTESNSIEFLGPVSFHPVSDAGIEMKLYDLNGPPIEINDVIQIIIEVTSYGGDVAGSGGVKVTYNIPNGLSYEDSFSPSGHGSYNNETGLWNVGNVLVGQPASIQINATVVGVEEKRLIQLAMVIDGSGSININDWNIITEGLSNAIKDDTIFPHDGSVELTVVQFGLGYNYYNHYYAQVEIEPSLIIDEDVAKDIADDIFAMNQGRSNTPMAAGIFLATDQLKHSPRFEKDAKQVITVVTDGMPNVWSDRPFSNYPIGPYGGFKCSYEEGKKNTVLSRNDSVAELEMTDTIDEIDALAVGVQGMYGSPDVDWLNESVIWPEPGIIWDVAETNDPQGLGWVATIDSFQDFELAINQMFKVIFNGISNTADFHSSTTFDPNNENNEAVLIITPESS